MGSLALTIKSGQKIVIEMDANKFEKLAASFGFFGQGFIKSLNRAEKDCRLKRTKKINSLKELRK